MKIYWYTTHRTKGVFLERLKNTSVKYIEHTRIKDQYSNNKFIKLIQMIIALKKRHITHILADGFSIEIFVVTLVAKYLGICVIIRVRGGMDNEYLEDILDRNTVIRNIKNLYFLQIRNFILRKADKIITVSVFGKAQILYELPLIPSTKIDCLIKPVIKRQRQGEVNAKINKLVENHKIITTVTSFRFLRKYDALIHYHKSILAVLRDNIQWNWVIAGEGKGLNQVKKTLLDSAHAMGVGNQINFLGFVEDIPSLLSLTDIFFYPSFRDTASQALKEGQIFGLPVMVNRSSCGPVEFIPPCEECQKQIFEETHELETTMAMLMNSEKYRNKLGELNKKFALENYNPERIVNRFLQLLNQ